MPGSGVISKIALTFAGGEDFDAQLDSALALAGEHLGVSRAYVFLGSADERTAHRIREWSADGLEPQIGTLQEVPFCDMPSWNRMLESETPSAIEDVGSLAADIKEAFEPRGALSVIVSPLRVEDRPCGFLALEECTRRRAWTPAEIETVNNIARIIAGAYSRQLLAERLAASEDDFRRFFDTVDDVIVVADLEGRLVFANEGASRTLGYSLEALRGKHILDLHPPDKRDEAERILEAMFRRELAHCPLELSARDGTRVPVETRVWFGEWDGQECVFGISKDLSGEQSALQKFERLFRGNPAAMAVTGRNDRRFVDVNEAFLDLLGYRREEVIGRSGDELGLFVDNERWLAASDELRRTGAIRNHEVDVYRRDGSILNGLFSGDLLSTQGNEYFLTVMLDVTELHELRAGIEAQHERLTNFIEGTRLGTWEWNVETGETLYNDRWAEIVGYTLAELQPTTADTWTRLAHPDDLGESERYMNLHLEGVTDHYECECRMRHKNGSWVWILDRGKVSERDGEGRPLKMFGTHSDITDKKALEQQIRELAIRDPLTGIFNRRYVLERLGETAAEYLRRGRNFCLTLLDIDHFKSVNDTHGHRAGDFVLTEFSHVMRASIRPYDILGRYGGEEFIIVSTSAGAEEIRTMIERIMETVHGRPLVFEGREIPFTFSGGLADSSESPRDALTIDEMIARADERLYAAKAAGRGRCVGP